MTEYKWIADLGFAGIVGVAFFLGLIKGLPYLLDKQVAERAQERAEFTATLSGMTAAFTGALTQQRTDLQVSCGQCRAALEANVTRMSQAVEGQSKLIQRHSDLLLVHISSTSKTVEELNRLLASAGSEPVEIAGKVRIKHGDAPKGDMP